MKSDLMSFVAAILSSLFIDTCSVATGTWIPAGVPIVNPPLDHRFHRLFKP